MSKKSGGFLLGAVIGGTAAAVAALLFAPKSGKELRDELAIQADDFKAKAYDYGEYVQEKSYEFTDIAKDKASDFTEQATEFAGTVKDKATKSSEEALSSFKKNTDDLSYKFKKTAAEI